MARSLLMVLALLFGSAAWASPATASGAPAAGPALAAPAQATPGVVIFYGYGEQVFEVGPLPKKYAKETWLAGYKSGIRCKFFALFWAYFHRWKCQPAVFQGKTYLREDLSSKKRAKVIKALHTEIEKKYSLKDAKLSWWALNGRWIVGGTILFLILLGIVRKARRRR